MQTGVDRITKHKVYPQAQHINLFAVKTNITKL
jgi:hypothetical protein